MTVVVPSKKWGVLRIMAGTILGGMLGFYVMHRMEISYKAKMNERLRIYKEQLEQREKEKLNEVEDPLQS